MTPPMCATKAALSMIARTSSTRSWRCGRAPLLFRPGGPLNMRVKSARRGANFASPPVASILVAASPEPRAILERILAGHELACAETMAQGEQLLRERAFDLIICTIVFDESKMFDFLRLAKSTLEWQRIPFICARVRAHILRSL